eukprot:gi/632978037/ref/XP_007905680.1/ PREDICTED: tumor necrosis factor receptor superfamily member 26-like [Callorhinchus milii]
MVDPCSEPDTEGVCRPCESQTYTEYENTEVRCFVCHRCRRGDQETVSNCTPHSNTVCQCKSGYFCSPKKTCEMCSKCRTCTAEQVIVRHCNSTSNTVCEARSGIAPETTGLSPGAITVIVIVVIAVVIAIVAGVRCWRVVFPCGECERV